MSRMQPHEGDCDVVVIGAGFAGLYLLHRLRDQLGMSVRVIERGDGVGGTWYWNRYPGARCDIESMVYCYSFNDELQQEWNWAERYAPQPEILAYINFVADRLDLRRSIDFGSSVESAEFDSLHDMWTVTTDAGESIRSRFVIAATGCLSVASKPSFLGMNDFVGGLYHTGEWPHESVDFTGQRVAVIGTGSSGIQCIPVIASQADELTVFQRTPAYSVPARNRPLSDAERNAVKSSYEVLRELARHAPFGTVNDAPIGRGAELDPTLVNRELERRWLNGGMSIQGTLTDSLVSSESNEIIAQFVRRKIRQMVKDPAVAALLDPRDYPIGTKRIVVDTNYYETFNRSNVKLVDVRDASIERFTANGLMVDGLEYEFDSIVLATGYDAMTGALNNIRIAGKDGQLLSDEWADGPKTYLGLAVHGFPNLFMVTGPGSPAVLSNVVVSIEQHVEWITDYIAHIRENDVASVEATQTAQDHWVAHVNDLAARTLFPTAASWYMGANVPGKPRVFMPYVGGVGVYRAECDEVVRNGYSGFHHAYHSAASAARPTLQETV